MKNKRDLLYKCLMSLVIAFFVAALYFNSVYVAERRFGQKTGSGDAEPDGGAGGKLDFTLLDQSGKGTKFTEFRGNIVFMVFWKQSNNDSYDLINLLIEKLPDSADVNNGKTGIALISVLVPDENDIPDTGGNTGAPQVSTGTPQDSSGTPQDSSGTPQVSGGLHQYIDTGGVLAGLFMLEDYPATYVFYPDGGLCGYYRGMMDARRIEGMLGQASESQ